MATDLSDHQRTPALPVQPEPDVEKLQLPERPLLTPTYELIRLHHMRAGHHEWGREKFRRVCIALNETEYEVGMRIGLSPAETRQRISRNSFRCSEGILLDLHLRFAQEAFTGTRANGTALAPITAASKTASHKRGEEVEGEQPGKSKGA